jgi:hypothetical protein
MMIPVLLLSLAQVPEASVGVAYSTGTPNRLRVVFPLSVKPGPQAIDGELVLFDEKGVLGRVKPKAPAQAVRWCENDGGDQWRPELTIDAPSTKRKLAPRERMQNIVAFVAVVKSGTKLRGVEWRTTDEERAFDGDFDGDGKPEAVIYLAPDDAKNCDGEPKNNLRVSLLAANRWSELRCCGP